ncbi:MULTISPECIES: type II secretion system protein [unclassified Methylophaga]|uniref:type II secretion system protein n=1 Tax=unclassified Methylophaga TaxID=2629249 RepID=UPI000C98FF91|nr:MULTISPECIES: prepilin-type N-terminal cleavage/methylation domain-containing protein [unclassified Methylophaga]MBN44988.1 hypothetical protein [Methylophaga sp.]|tara:strand:- start:71176 stop:72219 length:1044 start_codon:yes stop_codon:yes gene_type:complete
MQLPNKNFLSAKLQNLTNSHFQSGFTLLEMVLVLFLIGLLASAGLLFTEGVEDQAKYDETKRRMELIRKAIVGDTTRTINGAPEVSGFAADMGRLPQCIKELLVNETCEGVTIEPWSVVTDTGIGFGWRGPYIQVIADRDGKPRFRDGYGNVDADTLQDNKDFGWIFNISAATSSVQLQSLGFDPVSSLDDFPQPISAVVPSLIVNDDWKIKDIKVRFNNISEQNLPDDDSELLLRVFNSELSDYVDGGFSNSEVPITLAASDVFAEDTLTKTFVFDESSAIVQGIRTYAIVCYEVPSGDPDEYVIFDGDCVPPPGNSKPDSSTIRTFTVVPRNSLNLQLDWIIPTP